MLADRQTCVDAALQMAADIASKSPVAVQGTKVNIVFSRDHTVAESLDYAVYIYAVVKFCSIPTTRRTVVVAECLEFVCYSI